MRREHPLKKLIRRLWDFAWSERGRELIRYAVIGVLTTAVSFGTLWIFSNLFHINPNLANALSVICAVVFAYIANKLFVFRTHCDTAGELAREALSFFAARGVTMLLEVGGFSLLYELLHCPEMLAKVIISVVILVLNYVFSKLLVFRKKG